MIIRVDPAAERARRNAQYRSERFWFWICVALSAPLLLQMAAMFGLGHADILPRWLQLVLATPVQFWISRNAARHRSTAAQSRRGPSEHAHALSRD